MTNDPAAKFRPVPMEEEERWAHANRDTGKLEYVCPQNWTEVLSSDVTGPGQRLTRVRITEVIDD